MRRTIVAMASFALLAAACTPGAPPSESTVPQTTPAPTTQAPTAEPPPAGLVLPATAREPFAAFTPVKLIAPDAPAFPGVATPGSLDGVKVAQPLERIFEQGVTSRTLAAQGFVVVPSDYNQLHFLYDENFYSNIPSFVTTDAAYHVWHLVFDKLLRDIERETLLPALDEMVAGLLSAAETQAQELAGTPLEDAAARTVALYQVASWALGNKVALSPLATAEKELIVARGPALSTSAITGCQVAYSMFTPRGHYTRDADLTRYFMGMSVLGQLGFCLPGTIGAPSGDQLHDPLRLALLATRPLVNSPRLEELWTMISEPTEFLVGVADDYRPQELADAATTVSNGWLSDPATLAGDEALAKVVQQLVDTREILINPDRASVLLMGTRFVLDAWILDQLLPPAVGANAAGEMRSLPSALDLAAAFGSDLATQLQLDAGQGEFEGYEEQLAALADAVENRPEAEWGNTVYDAWLHAIAASFAKREGAFPDYQRSPQWDAKTLQSGLGSYAELKHDTILYAKQAFAEGGGDPYDPAALQHAVEADPVVFERLAGMAELLRTGLADRDLLGNQRQLLDDTINLFTFLGGVARTQLAGGQISVADNERLFFIGGELEGFALRTGDLAAEGTVDRDQDNAIVADIATGVGPDGSTTVLEVATGRFDRILVLVPAADGFQVAVGAVYSFYEFTSDSGERLTDEAWRALLDAGRAPARPDWQGVLFPRL